MRRWKETAELHQFGFLFWSNWCHVVTPVPLGDKVPVSATSIQSWKLWDVMYGENPLATPPGPSNFIYRGGEGCLCGGIWVWGMSHAPESPWSSCHYCSLCPNEVGCVFLYDCFQNVNTLGLELADTVSEITAVRLGQFLKWCIIKRGQA